MRRVPWRLLGWAAVSAVLLDLPFPLAGPLPAWRSVFAWFALVPLVVEVLRLAEGSAVRSRRWVLGWAFLAGWLCGALWFGANCYWVYDTMHIYGGMSGPLAAFSLVLFSLYLGFWFGVFALALAIVRMATVGSRVGWAGLAAVPFLWVGMEFALARVPEFPWDLLGYSQVDNGLLMRLAPWTGVYGISFLVAAENAWFAVLARHHKRFGFGGFLFSWFFIFLLNFGGRPVEQPVPTATAVLIQPNLDVGNEDIWVGAEWTRRMAQFGALGSESCGSFNAGMPEVGAQRVESKCGMPMAATALIAWPESPAGFRDVDPLFQSTMAGIVAADHAPVIVGSWGLDTEKLPDGVVKNEIYNSASVFGVDGRPMGRYDKIRLVPFGEYVPMREVLFFAKGLTANLPDLSVGKERRVFSIKSADGASHRYGVFICYESVFGDEVRQFAKNGAEVLVNISDDGWYGDTSAPWQHLNMARMRAAENRRWILRDTNNGVTSSIDPYGTVRQSIDRHRVGALAAKFGYSSERTFYMEHGDWVGWVCVVVAVGISFCSIGGLVRLANAAPIPYHP